MSKVLINLLGIPGNTQESSWLRPCDGRSNGQRGKAARARLPDREGMEQVPVSRPFCFSCALCLDAGRVSKVSSTPHGWWKFHRPRQAATAVGFIPLVVLKSTEATGSDWPQLRSIQGRSGAAPWLQSRRAGTSHGPPSAKRGPGPGRAIGTRSPGGRGWDHRLGSNLGYARYTIGFIYLFPFWLNEQGHTWLDFMQRAEILTNIYGIQTQITVDRKSLDTFYRTRWLRFCGQAAEKCA